MDKKRLRDSPPDQAAGPFRPQAGAPGNGAEYLPDGHAGLQDPHERQRREVLLRVVRISDALNQRLAL